MSSLSVGSAGLLAVAVFASSLHPFERDRFQTRTSKKGKGEREFQPREVPLSSLSPKDIERGRRIA